MSEDPSTSEDLHHFPLPPTSQVHSFPQATNSFPFTFFGNPPLQQNTDTFGIRSLIEFPGALINSTIDESQASTFAEAVLLTADKEKQDNFEI